MTPLDLFEGARVTKPRLSLDSARFYAGASWTEQRMQLR
jgi:hypothetical protein